MGIRVAWANEERAVMFWQFDALWTWDDWHAAADISVKLRKASPSQPRVVVILNLSGSRVLPRNPLQHARRALQKADPRDVIVLVGSTFSRFLASTFRELYPTLAKSFYVVGSFDEALALANTLRGASAVYERI